MFQSELSGAKCLHARLTCPGIQTAGSLHSHWFAKYGKLAVQQCFKKFNNSMYVIMASV